MFKKIMICAAATAGLLACTPDEPVQQKAPPGSAAGFIVKPGFDQSRILGVETVTIVASTPQRRGAISWDKALPGSRCTAESAEIAVNFTTPTPITLPVVRGRPSPLTINCASGALSGAIQKQPTLIESNESGNMIFDQPNIVAGVVFGAIAANQERREAEAQDAWRYIEVSQGVRLQ